MIKVSRFFVVYLILNKIDYEKYKSEYNPNNYLSLADDLGLR